MNGVTELSDWPSSKGMEISDGKDFNPVNGAAGAAGWQYPSSLNEPVPAWLAAARCTDTMHAPTFRWNVVKSVTLA